MKYSKFNHRFDVNDGSIIYNSLSSGVLRLNKYYTDIIKNSKDVSELSQDLFDNLKLGGMIVDNNLDEVDRLVLRDRISRFSTEALGLTIAPTLKCNFACDYCYEAGYNYTTMDEETINKTIKFILDKMKDIKAIGLTWYGGEPLLAVDIIRRITHEILSNKPDEVMYQSHIITNGYNLTVENALKLKELQISKVQVTIDGPPSIHNKRRKLHNGGGSFDRIMKNVIDVCDILNIVIRINVDKSNFDYLEDLLTIFDENGIKDKVPFYIAPVDDIATSCKNPSCYNEIEFSDRQIQFMKLAYERGFKIVTVPPSIQYLCGAVALNNFIIDPSGDLYKCWDEIGRETEKIGDVENGLLNNGNLEKWLLYDPFKASECRDCSVLPVCLGGCPYYNRVTSKTKCATIKSNYTELLSFLDKINQVEKNAKVTI